VKAQPTILQLDRLVGASTPRGTSHSGRSRPRHDLSRIPLAGGKPVRVSSLRLNRWSRCFNYSAQRPRQCPWINTPDCLYPSSATTVFSSIYKAPLQTKNLNLVQDCGFDSCFFACRFRPNISRTPRFCYDPPSARFDHYTLYSVSLLGAVGLYIRQYLQNTAASFLAFQFLRDFVVVSIEVPEYRGVSVLMYDGLVLWCGIVRRRNFVHQPAPGAFARGQIPTKVVGPNKYQPGLGRPTTERASARGPRRRRGSRPRSSEGSKDELRALVKAFVRSAGAARNVPGLQRRII
jgi:hypothetical protein